jgi:diacylglycerol kinase (ATP)
VDARRSFQTGSYPVCGDNASGNIEKLLLIGSMVLVMLVELLNSAVEVVVDRVGFEHHELSGRAKDIGSAAVMMSLAWAAVTWALILL